MQSPVSPCSCCSSSAPTVPETACAGTVHSTYAVVLSTRDPNIPCTMVPRQVPLESCDFSPTLYTFDTVVATPARVLRCVEREARGTRTTTRYNKAKTPRVTRVSVSMDTRSHQQLPPSERSASVDIAVRPGELRAVSFLAADGIRQETISEGC